MIEILNWKRHFENDASLKVQKANWFPCPNRMDSVKFVRVLRESNGLEIFGFWILLCELASRPACPNRDGGNRGRISDSIEDIAVMFNIEIKKAVSILTFLSKIGWIRMDTDVIPEGKGMNEGKGMEGNRINTFAPTCDKPAPSKPPKIEFDFEVSEFRNITNKHLELWKEAYPACNLNRQLNAAAAWLTANPKKKKKNYQAFITNWLSRAQQRGGG